jgi:hypothetical protein
MPGLVPGIRVFIGHQVVDGRDKPGHDEHNPVVPAVRPNGGNFLLR